MLIFVTGGVRSGKSSYAETLAMTLQRDSNQKLYYIATSLVEDKEMMNRVQKHRETRRLAPTKWHLIEKSHRLHELNSRFDEHDVVLVDCLTTLLSNEWFRGLQGEIKQIENPSLVVDQMKEWLDSLSDANWVTILVSNELSYEASDDEMTQSYKKSLGELHIHAVECAKKAILVESGIPMFMKGSD